MTLISYRFYDIIKKYRHSINSFLDLKQELKIRNIAIPNRPGNSSTNDTSEVEPMDTSIPPQTPSKNRQQPATRDVSRLNDINDSRNNNSLLDKTSSTAYNSSHGDTTILNNMSFDSTTATINNNNDSILKSHNNVETFNKTSQSNSVLKCKLLKLLVCWRVVD